MSYATTLAFHQNTETIKKNEFCVFVGKFTVQPQQQQQQRHLYYTKRNKIPPFPYSLSSNNKKK